MWLESEKAVVRVQDFMLVKDTPMFSKGSAGSSRSDAVWDKEKAEQDTLPQWISQQSFSGEKGNFLASPVLWTEALPSLPLWHIGPPALNGWRGHQGIISFNLRLLPLDLRHSASGALEFMCFAQWMSSLSCWVSLLSFFSFLVFVSRWLVVWLLFLYYLLQICF